MKNLKHIVSLSFGKDSTAMLLMMIEKGMQIDEILFADTTLEFPEMYEYIEIIEKYIGMKVTKVKSDKDFYKYFSGKTKRGSHIGTIRGFPIAFRGCYIMRSWKKEPLEKAQGIGNIIYLGIAYNEKHRVNRKEYINSKNKYLFPLVEWKISEKDCINYLKKRNLINPCYSLYHRNKTGCWLCPNQSILSLKKLYNYHRKYWNKLIKLQKISKISFRSDYSLEQLKKRFELENMQEILPFPIINKQSSIDNSQFSIMR